MVRVITCLAVLLAIALLVAGASRAYSWIRRNRELDAAIRKVDATLLASDAEACKKRLATLRQAWWRYRQEHRGQEPPTIEALLPKYLPSPDLLICPTAARLRKAGRMPDHGILRWRGKEYPVTYGFRWLTPNNAVYIRRMGEKAPLLTCATHQEVVSRSIYRMDPDSFTCPPAEAARLDRAGIPWHILTIRRDGELALEAER